MCPSGDWIHQTPETPLSCEPRLSSRSPPNSSLSLHSDIQRQAGWTLGGCPQPPAEPGPTGVGQGVAEGWQVGYCPPQTEGQTEGQTEATLEAALTSSLKELIIDFSCGFSLSHDCILEGCDLDDNCPKQHSSAPEPKLVLNIG